MRPAHVQVRPGEVHVAPLQRPQLTKPQAGVRRHADRRRQLLVGRRPRHRLDLLDVKHVELGRPGQARRAPATIALDVPSPSPHRRASTGQNPRR
jgi:hypothetical protein